MQSVNIFWFRRDLRLFDNKGLCEALDSGVPVLPVFIFDNNILDKLDNKADSRVGFIHRSLEKIQDILLKVGSTLEVFYSTPEESFEKLCSTYNIQQVFANHDYEPYGRSRDASIAALLEKKGVAFQTYKDQVIFEKHEVVKDDGKPYTVFTPYSRKWKARFQLQQPKKYRSENFIENFYKQDTHVIPSLESFGFSENDCEFPPDLLNENLVLQYKAKRDFPAAGGTSKLSVHLRFGTISIRQLVLRANLLSETFLNELIWREFYQMILWHFPGVGSGASFKPAYDHIEWRRDQGEFERWCHGETGYPIVDAGMRELNTTGFMHNRVRMVVASFLCKHLLLDWRLGEAYFAEKLFDFELASNNGGWQWAAGSGCDAAPYFRIFNPYLQTKKFDPQNAYIEKWVPEWQVATYPKPIVDHAFARQRCLEVYAKALRKNG